MTAIVSAQSSGPVMTKAPLLMLQVTSPACLTRRARHCPGSDRLCRQALLSGSIPCLEDCPMTHLELDTAFVGQRFDCVCC